MKINSTICFVLTILWLSAIPTAIFAQDNNFIVEGRWNLTIHAKDNNYASWLEVKPWSNFKVGSFLHIGGYPRPLSKIDVDGNSFSFSLPWTKEDDILMVKGNIDGDIMEGNIYYPDGNILQISGVRAPELPFVKDPEWGKPIILFNGKNLNGWQATGVNQWIVESGVLKSPKPGSNLISDQKFMDFKLHIEFRYPKHGNSGVYLRGRYEVQICDGKGKVPSSDQFGSIFGFLEPNEMVAKEPGEWQTYDITLIGRRVTIQANGIIIINDQRIPAITGGAIDSNELEPGPFMLQGDHAPIEYKNIVITPRIRNN